MFCDGIRRALGCRTGAIQVIDSIDLKVSSSLTYLDAKNLRRVHRKLPNQYIFKKEFAKGHAT